ncbi:hypothetical protein [Candidatus Uabimicrobium amorphum]|uniref:Methyltransferase domain-containing protein n=1 Tax=Uabimicrobium amorphum TaxID=2596890 RepID=A0A5S9IH40_UABAM|nr:hypothetical protein [Candidatus Uabimicrobium amorphum]BBM81688.1 hypothetical protein UABAM_00027 [Candidatus Uabimicrobium amorphum]
MKYPIRLNKYKWGSLFTKYLPSAYDPRKVAQENLSRNEFSQSVSAFCFDNVYKITKSDRHPLTNSYLSTLFAKPTIVDIGASDGTTSMDVMEACHGNFSHYYITDLNMEVSYYHSKNTYYFFNDKDECILMANNYFVIYPGDKESVALFKFFAKKIYKLFVDSGKTKTKVQLVNPELKKCGDSITVKKFDIFDTWDGDKADIVIVANLLNKCYFSDENIVKALHNVFSFIKNPGYLAVIHDLQGEKACIFRIEKDEIFLEKEINGGVEVKNLVLGAFSSKAN